MLKKQQEKINSKKTPEFIKMKKIFYLIILQLFFFSNSSSNNIDIQLNLELNLNCKVEKIILKNKNHNFETFSPDELNVKNFKVVKINSIIPETLSIKGLSEFLFNNKNFDVKIVNKEIVYFKALNLSKNYSESGILTRKTGELIHEITKNIKSSKKEKNIIFFNCKTSS